MTVRQLWFSTSLRFDQREETGCMQNAYVENKSCRGEGRKGAWEVSLRGKNRSEATFANSQAPFLVISRSAHSFCPYHTCIFEQAQSTSNRIHPLLSPVSKDFSPYMQPIFSAPPPPYIAPFDGYIPIKAPSTPTPQSDPSTPRPAMAFTHRGVQNFHNLLYLLHLHTYIAMDDIKRAAVVESG